MTKTASLRLIDRAYSALAEDGALSNHIGKLFDMCEDEERRHRRCAPYGHRFGITVKQAAHLFTVRTIAQAQQKPDRWTIADVLSIKASTIYAAAIVLKFPRQVADALAPFPASDILALDYVQLVEVQS